MADDLAGLAWSYEEFHCLLIADAAPERLREVSRAIRERGGYQLMPEWATNPANHYLPRRRTEVSAQPDQLVRADNPLKKDGQLPKPAPGEPSLDDVTSW